MFNKKQIARWGLIVIILITAFFLRGWNIENLPAGIYPDEAVNGTDALKANETGEYHWFYTNNYGREGLYINLIAFSVKIFGNTVWGLKFWAIVFGTLTVGGIWLLSRELFPRFPFVSHAAAFFTTFSFWAINFSRIAFRAGMMLPILVFSFYFLFRGWRFKKNIDFLWAGLIFGLGFHTYIAFRVAPLILIILFFGLWWIEKNFWRRWWKKLLIFALAATFTAAPLFWDFYRHPEYFQSRASAISVLSPEINHGKLFSALAQTISLSLIKYNFWGDQNWRHNYPPYPILNPLVGILFLIGLFYSFLRFFQLFRKRLIEKKRDSDFLVFLFLLSWFFTMLIPEFLTYEGLPHALRSIGTLPVVFILAALPASIFWGKISAEQLGGFKLALFSLFFLMAISVAVFDTTKYFYFFAHNPEQHSAFNENFKNQALYLKTLPPTINKYILTNGGGRMMEDGLPVSAQSIKFLDYENLHTFTFLQTNEEIPLKTPMEIILMNYDQNFIDRVKAIYPSTEIKKIDLNPGYGSDFVSIFVK